MTSRLLSSLSLAVLLAACTTPADNGSATSSSSAQAVASAVFSAGGSQNRADIILDQPLPGSVVTSPLTITGQARGWYFEASFPVRLLDSAGNEIAITPAQAQGDWMTTDFVPFQATLTFETASQNGTLVLEKDNPSGEPQNDASLSVPVRF